MAISSGGNIARPGEIYVLLVDDHPIMRQGVRAILESGQGFTVVGEATTGAEAIDAVRRLHPDIVLMDVSMPDMDGIDATRVIKKEIPTTAVIIFTGHENTDYLRDAIIAGASGYLVKGVPPDVLREGLTLVKNGESLIDTKLLGSMLTNMQSSVQAFTPPAPDPVEELTPLEKSVLQGVVEGMTNTQIAIQLHYSVGTIKNAVQRIIEKLQVSDRTQAAVKAVQSGLLAG